MCNVTSTSALITTWRRWSLNQFPSIKKNHIAFWQHSELFLPMHSFNKLILQQWLWMNHYFLSWIWILLWFLSYCTVHTKYCANIKEEFQDFIVTIIEIIYIDSRANYYSLLANTHLDHTKRNIGSYDW